MGRAVLKILFIILFFVGNNPCSSQSKDSIKYSTKEIKVVSNKVETDIYSSPARIEVMGREFISLRNGERLSDILESAGGVFIKSYGNSSSLQTISINGLGAEQTLILLNGSKLNSYQNGQIDLSLISKNNIEKIEIVSNGYSSVYGSDAVGGVVNIITEKNKKSVAVNLSTRAGSYGYKRVYLDLNSGMEKLSLSAGISDETSEDNFDYYYHSGNSSDLKTRENNSYTFRNYFTNLDFEVNKEQSLSYYSSLSVSNKNIPGLEAGTVPSNTKQDDKNWNNILSYNLVISDRYSVKSDLNFQNNLMNYYDDKGTDSYYKNIVFANKSNVDYSGDNMKLTGGYDVTYATINSGELLADIKRYQAGIFIASEYTPIENLKIFPSVRYDNVSDVNENNIAGKIGVNYKPFKEEELYLRGNAGNNYSVPTFNQLYWKEGGNENLRTQKSFNIETGFIYRFNFITDNIFEFSYTGIDFKDKIVWQPGSNGIWSPVNIDRSRSEIYSFDGKISKVLFENSVLTLGMNYTYTKSIKKSASFEGDPSEGKQIFYIPEELSKVNMGFSYKEAGINLYYRFIGKRYTNSENTRFLPAVDLLDGNVYYNYSLWKLDVQAKFEVNNLTDADYEIISGYPMPLRNFKFGISIRY